MPICPPLKTNSTATKNVSVKRWIKKIFLFKRKKSGASLCQLLMSTKYQMWKLSFAMWKKAFSMLFSSSCNGAYNNVHKLSIHWMALSANLFSLLFHHLPHIHSLHSQSTLAHTRKYKHINTPPIPIAALSMLNPFFPVRILFAFCSCLFARNFFLCFYCCYFFSRVRIGRLCLPFHHCSLFLSRHILHYVRISTIFFSSCL